MKRKSSRIFTAPMAKVLEGAKRAALLLALLLSTTVASATSFIKDVMLIGGSKSEVNDRKATYTAQGWTFIDYDLNKGCGSSSDYVYLLYKAEESSDDINQGYITDFYIREGKEPPSSLTYDGRLYNKASYDGGEWFVSHYGDLNSNCGSGSAYIFLYYTKDFFPDNRAVTSITFNTSSSGAVVWNGNGDPADLNKGCGSGTPYIYMHITTAATKAEYRLTENTGDVTLHDGTILTGTGGAYTHVCIADGATVTLSGITLNGNNWGSTPWAGITCLGDATLILAEGTTNNVTNEMRFHRDYPGIFVPEGKTLTIQGEGALNVQGVNAAGIGGGNKMNCGNIVIAGGTINAIGNGGAAGIGSGLYASCGDITITNGITKVVATCNSVAEPIGTGYQSTCGTVTIDPNLDDKTEGKTRTLYSRRPIEAPEGLKAEAYAFKSKTRWYYQEEGWDDELHEIHVGFNGKDVYFKGLDDLLPDSWVKGTLSDDGQRVTIPVNQYMGSVIYWDSGFSDHYYITGVDEESNLVDLVLNYDTETFTFTTDQTMVLNNDRWTLAPCYYYTDIVITKTPDVAATPADPKVTTVEFTDTYYPKIRLNIPMTDTEGNPILTDKLYYTIWYEKDGTKKQWTVLASDYEDVDEDMVEIPYNFDDHYDIYQGGNIVYLNPIDGDYASWTDVGVQSIYYGGGKRNTSNICWMITTGIQGIKDEGFLNESSGKAERRIKNDNAVYDLAGRKVSHSLTLSPSHPLPRGIYIMNGKKVVMK